MNDRFEVVHNVVELDLLLETLEPGYQRLQVLDDIVRFASGVEYFFTQLREGGIIRAS